MTQCLDFFQIAFANPLQDKTIGRYQLQAGWRLFFLQFIGCIKVGLVTFKPQGFDPGIELLRRQLLLWIAQKFSLFSGNSGARRILAVLRKVTHRPAEKYCLTFCGQKTIISGSFLERDCHETHLSAFGCTSQAYSRLPCAHAHAWRSFRDSCSSRQGPQIPERLIV